MNDDRQIITHGPVQYIPAQWVVFTVAETWQGPELEAGARMAVNVDAVTFIGVDAVGLTTTVALRNGSVYATRETLDELLGTPTLVGPDADPA